MAAPSAAAARETLKMAPNPLQLDARGASLTAAFEVEAAVPVAADPVVAVAVAVFEPVA